MSRDDGLEWVKLDLHLYRDEAFAEAVLDGGVALLGVWAAIILEAKRSPSFGRFRISLRRFAHHYGAGADDPRLWQLLAGAGLVELPDGPLDDGPIDVVVPRFDKWQTPRGKSPAERQREARSRHADAVTTSRASRDESRPGRDMSRACHDDVTGVSRRLETRDIDEERSNERSVGKRAERSAPVPDVEAEIARCRETLNGLSPFVDQLVDAMRCDNKTGKVSARRTLRELWLPIAGLVDELPRPALRHGLEAAARASAPNARYVAKAARGYDPPAENAAEPETRYTSSDRFVW